jgi:hypothetical protein
MVFGQRPSDDLFISKYGWWYASAHTTLGKRKTRFESQEVRMCQSMAFLGDALGYGSWKRKD